MRAAIRLIRRNLRRAVRTNLLVVGLIALSVALGVYASVAVRSQTGSAIDYYRDEVGNSEFRVAITNAEDPDRVVEALEQRGLSVLQVEDLYIPAVLPDIKHTYAHTVDTSVEQLRSNEVILDLEGRQPQVAGEVALTRRLAAAGGLKVGDTTKTISGSRVTVVGLIQVRGTSNQQVVYLPPGLLDEERARQPAGGERTFVVGISGVSRTELSEILRDEVGGEEFVDVGSEPQIGEPFYRIDTRQSAIAYGFDEGGASTIGAIVSSVMLFQTGLISAVAFIVSLRRRTLDMGRLRAIGAEPAQLRRMLTIEAAMLGFVAAIVGTAGGLAALYLQAKLVEPWIVGDLQYRPFDVRWTIGDLFWPAALAIIAAMAAMWFPARWAANLSPEQARNGGYKQRQVPRLLIPGSVAVLLLGLFLLLVASYLASSSGFPEVGLLYDLLIPLSGVPIILGAGGLVYAVMGLLYNGSFRLFLPLRLGARDALRNPIRSVGAVAAYMVLLTFTVAAFSVETSGYQQANTDVERSLRSAAEGRTSSLALFDVGSTEQSDLGWIDLANPAKRVTWTEPSTLRDSDVVANVLRTTELGLTIPPSGTAAVEYLNVYSLEIMVLGTPQLLQKLEVSEQTKEAMESGSQLVLLSPMVDDKVRYDIQVDSYSGPVFDENDSTFTVEIEPSDPFNGMPVLLIPPTLAERNGWETSASTIIYRERGFTNSELRSLQQAGYTTPGWLGGEAPVSPELIYIVVVSILILILSRILAGLASVDTADELASVMAVGAPARFRRTQLAWQTGYGVALAVAAAIPLGLVVPMVYAAGSNNETSLTGPSWTVLGGLFLLPLLSAGFIFLTTRSAQPSVSHRLV